MIRSIPNNRLVRVMPAPSPFMRRYTALPSLHFINPAVYRRRDSSLVSSFSTSAPATSTTTGKPTQMSQQATHNKPESEWQAILTSEQFRILRQKGTEQPHSGAYDKHAAQGVYHCAGCNTPLYRSTTKFDSGCGWPAFYEGLPGAILRSEDLSLGRRRVEITCAACGGHLGHVFKGEGYDTPTDERHCVNSVSLAFVDEK